VDVGRPKDSTFSVFIHQSAIFSPFGLTLAVLDALMLNMA
jgi:hypothetical protein